MIELILQAGLVVKAVLLLLIGASVASWAVIAYKSRELRNAELDTEDFLEAFDERPLEAAYDVAKSCTRSPLAAVFRAGFKDLSQLERLHGGKKGISPEQVESIVKRLVRVQTEEGHRLGRGLAFLATTGSAAPFVGLFGTVVGIMNSFRDIGATGSATLAVVAPGIAEALVATAVGLFAAIPAVVAYNYAGTRLGRLIDRTEAFRTEFETILRRAVRRAA